MEHQAKEPSSVEDYMQQLRNTVQFLKEHIDAIPETAIVLGSGLGGLAQKIECGSTLDYSVIPGFKATTVVGHAGKLVIGKLSGKNVIAMQGRFHLYEGHDVSRVVFPVRVFALLGIKNLILTNAAGGVNRQYHAGDFMLIRDHVGLFAPSPLKGPNLEEIGTRFPDMSRIYHLGLRELVVEQAQQLNLTLQQGIYAYTPGPSFETPAEIRFLEALGVDAVGMSTVPEAVAARHAGMNVLGISCITNMAAGILNQPLSHDEVSQTANQSGKAFCSLIENIIGNMEGI